MLMKILSPLWASFLLPPSSFNEEEEVEEEEGSEEDDEGVDERSLKVLKA